MNSIFTICAKNYLPLAKTLVDSIALHTKTVELNLYVFVADEFAAEQCYSIENCQIISAKELGIDNLDSLAFKYNVTEFCTALKPFCIDYVAKEKNCDKIIYFDPDICTFSDLTEIFHEIEDKLCMLTPHYVIPELNYSGTVTEEMILWGGIFNLGFIAVNSNHSKYEEFISWWKNRLYYKSFADKQDGLHTDQKWIDYLMAYYPNHLNVSHHLGYNVSVWNLHERAVVEDETDHYIIRDPKGNHFQLVFFHFSGFDFNGGICIHKHHPSITTQNRPDLSKLMNFYREQLTLNGIHKTLSWGYTYDRFLNGMPIIQFQRRLFRRLTSQNISFDNPFSTGDKTFFKLLKENKLLTNKNSSDRLNSEHLGQFKGKIKLALNLFTVLQRLIGIEKYSLFLRFLNKYVRPENQTFLIKDFRKDFKFYNENKV